MGPNIVKNGRNPSMDILKCLAAIFITNSHMKLLYYPYEALATGGAIGDVLFFFCSGFTILLGRGGDFFNWYKRRINRIYPTVFATAIIASFLFDVQNDMKNIIINGGGWFVSCIMIYYVILWFIRTYFIDKLAWVFGTVSIFVIVWYVFFFENKEVVWMYKATYFKWCHYFLFMLFGAIMGVNLKNRNFSLKLHLGWDFAKLMVCILLFYGIQILGGKNMILAYMQPITLIPLLGITFYFYKICNAECILDFYTMKWPHRIIYWISALCLEIYLIQNYLFTDRMNAIFPFNIFVMFIVIAVCAYGVKVLSNWFGQTFREGDYAWKKMITL